MHRALGPLLLAAALAAPGSGEVDLWQHRYNGSGDGLSSVDAVYGEMAYDGGGAGAADDAGGDGVALYAADYADGADAADYADVVTPARQLSAQYGAADGCVWPTCASMCFLCNRVPLSTCSLGGFLTPCPGGSRCTLGMCTCPPDTCANKMTHRCVERVCIDGGSVPPFEPPSAAWKLYNFGPNAPHPDEGSLVAWLEYAASCLGAPMMLLIVGIVIAYVSHACLKLGLECGEMWMLPKAPWLLLGWGVATLVFVIWATAVRHYVLASAWETGSGGLYSLEEDFTQVRDLGLRLNETCSQLQIVFDDVPSSCSGLVPFSKTAMNVLVNSIHRETKKVFDEVYELNNQLEPMPGRIAVLRKSLLALKGAIVWIPLVPLLFMIGSSCVVIGATLVSWCHEDVELAQRADVILDKWGSRVVATVICAAAILASGYFHVGIVGAGWCIKPDENFIGLVNNTNWTSSSGKDYNAEALAAVQYYISGIGPNPLVQELTKVTEGIDGLEHIYNDSKGMIDTVSFVCPDFNKINVTEIVGVAKDITLSASKLLQPEHVYPYYQALFHEVICTDVVQSIGSLIWFNVIVGFVMFPMLALIADVDLKKWVDHKRFLENRLPPDSDEDSFDSWDGDDPRFSSLTYKGPTLDYRHVGHHSEVHAHAAAPLAPPPHHQPPEGQWMLTDSLRERAAQAHGAMHQVAHLQHADVQGLARQIQGLGGRSPTAPPSGPGGRPPSSGGQAQAPSSGKGGKGRGRGGSGNFTA